MNSDLPSEVVMQMAPFALAGRLKRKGIEQMFTGINTTTPFRHRAWFYWNALLLSDISHLWRGPELNTDSTSLRGWLREINQKATPDQVNMFCRRMFRRSLNYWPGHDPTTRSHTFWTKGGNWPVRWGMSKIIVMHQHIEREKNWWSVDQDKMEAFERELMHTFDPDKLLQPEAYFSICNYAQQRYPQIRGVKTKLSRGSLTWLFQQVIQWEGERSFIPRNRIFSWGRGTNRPKSYMLEW